MEFHAHSLGFFNQNELNSNDFISYKTMIYFKF